MLRTNDRIATPNPDWDSSSPDPATSNAPFRIYNIGNNAPVKLDAYIEAIEAALGMVAKRELLPLQIGDVPDTFADVSDLVQAVGYKPATPVTHGSGILRQMVPGLLCGIMTGPELLRRSSRYCRCQDD